MWKLHSSLAWRMARDFSSRSGASQGAVRAGPHPGGKDPGKGGEEGHDPEPRGSSSAKWGDGSIHLAVTECRGAETHAGAQDGGGHCPSAGRDAGRRGPGPGGPCPPPKGIPGSSPEAHPWLLPLPVPSRTAPALTHYAERPERTAQAESGCSQQVPKRVVVGTPAQPLAASRRRLFYDKSGSRVPTRGGEAAPVYPPEGPSPPRAPALSCAAMRGYRSQCWRPRCSPQRQN